jgi:hypothetical protein
VKDELMPMIQKGIAHRRFDPIEGEESTHEAKKDPHCIIIDLVEQISLDGTGQSQLQNQPSTPKNRNTAYSASEVDRDDAETDDQS